MADRFDRERLVKLLGMLGSAHDGEVLNAARHIDAMVRASGRDWDRLLGPDDAPRGPKRGADRADLQKLDELLASTRVSDILKLRLTALREQLQAGRLADQDRHLLRMLHRKAVIEGAVVSA